MAMLLPQTPDVETIGMHHHAQLCSIFCFYLNLMFQKTSLQAPTFFLLLYLVFSWHFKVNFLFVHWFLKFSCFFKNMYYFTEFLIYILHWVFSRVYFIKISKTPSFEFVFSHFIHFDVFGVCKQKILWFLVAVKICVLSYFFCPYVDTHASGIRDIPTIFVEWSFW